MLPLHFLLNKVRKAGQIFGGFPHFDQGRIQIFTIITI